MKKLNIYLISVLFLGLINFVSCTKTTQDSKSKEVHLAIWGNYILPETQKQFTDKTGIQIKITNYSSNEELLAKVQAGASEIDVAVPSENMVDVMTKLNLLEPLDKEKIPNRQGLAAQVLHQAYDPENKFSLPYAWTTSGIAINRELFKGEIKSWKDVFDNPTLAGKIALLDDMREVVGAALKYHGYSVNTTNPQELAKAKETLLKLKPKVKMFTSDSVDILKNKEVAVAHAYSSDSLQASAKVNGKIDYIIPSEGATRSIDNLVIIKNAKNKENAHALINFLLSKDVNLAFVQNILAGPVRSETKDLVSDTLKKNTALFPSSESLSHLEKIIDQGDKNKLFEDVWTAVKTSH